MYTKIHLLMGMPRSGTSWLSQIFDSHPDVRFRLSPLFSYDFKNRLNETSTREEWEVVLRGAYGSDSAFMDQTERRKRGEYPIFPAKAKAPVHFAIKDTRFHNLARRALELLPNLDLIALVRHPCGAMHSWLTSKGEFPAGADPMAEWRSGRCRKTGYGEYWGFDDWKQVTDMHLELARIFPGRVLIQRYEDLVRDSRASVGAIFAFAGL